MRRPDFDLDDTPLIPWIAAAGAFCLGWLLLAWPWLSGRFTIPWDAKAQFLPQIQFLADSLARGDSPAWNPFVFSGHPQLADPQSMIFSPPFLLLALFNGAPSPWAVDTTTYLAILAGGLALIAWFRDRGWHAAGAVLAAVSFAFGAAMAWRIQHTGQVLSLSLLPVVLLLLDRALERSSVVYALAAGLTAGCLVLGRDQVALLSVYLLLAYVVSGIAAAHDPAAAARRAAVPLAAGAIAGLVLVAVPLALTVDLAAQSNRPAIDFIGAGRGSLHPGLALTFFAPDLYGSSGRMWDYWGPPSFAWQGTGLFLAQNMGQLYIGAIPALLVLASLGSGLAWRREIRFFTLALAVIVIYALGWYTPVFRLFHAVLPGVDLYRRPADAVFLIGFCASVLAGYTAHAVLTSHDGLADPRLQRGAAFAALVTVLAFALATGLAMQMGKLDVATRPLLISAALFALAAAVLADALWLMPIRPLLAAALLIAVTVGDLAIQNGPGSATALPLADFDALDPASRNETLAILKRKTTQSRTETRRDRVELVGLGFHWPNASITHRLENTLGYNPVRLGLYSQATGAGDTVGLVEQRTFSPLFPSYRSTLADLLGLRWIATPVPLKVLDPSVQPGDFVLLAQTPDAYIYENPRAFPRVLFAASAAPADFDTILNTGRWPAEDLSATVLLSPEDDKASGLVATRGQGQARLVRYANTEVEIEVDSTRGGFVVLNDLWTPAWTATLDGTTTKVLRANVLFRAVRVPSGRHTVRFKFRPIATLLERLVSRRE